MQVGTAPIWVTGTSQEYRQVIGWGGFTAKEIRAEDRIEFSGSDSDFYGMPAMTIHYSLSEKDEAVIASVIETLAKAAPLLGTFLDDATPWLLPTAVRCTARARCVWDSMTTGHPSATVTRKWGMANVYVGGNGVIPTATVCNPTATAVALAVLASRALPAQLSA